MKKVAIYLRLSKEDEYIRDESNSISSQRQILLNHIRTVPEFRGMEVIEIKDDGYSGKNMERPGVQELLQMVKAGKIAAILCKDISRYSRDYLVAGKYLEQIFPFMGVRFIAVNDHYDSKNFTGGIAEIDVAFKEILYDYYSEDLSVKVKSSLLTGKRNGKHNTGYVPYGYKKDPNDRHKVVIDEEAAGIVRDIFDRALKGAACNRIALELNTEGVECPGAYKERTCGANFRRKYDRRLWSLNRIREILSDEFYVGTYVFHKCEMTEVGGKRRYISDRDKWERLHDHHPAIISREDFDEVQRLLASRSRKKGVPVRHHFLSGKVACGICGANLQHSWSGRPKFFCARNYQLPHGQRHERNAMNDDVIEDAILKELEREAALRADANQAEEAGRKAFRAKAAAAEKRLSEGEAALKQIYEEQRTAYESYRLGKMDRESFMVQKERLDRLEEEAQERVAALKRAFVELEETPDGFIDVLAGLSFEDGKLSFDHLTEEMADTFLEGVKVWPDGRMEIKWRFGNNT